MAYVSGSKRWGWSRLFHFLGSLGLGASSLAIGLAGTVISFPAQATQPPGLLRGIVCAVPINLCLKVVTHAIVNGATVEREYPLIPALGPLSLLPGQPIDVTGDGRDDLVITLAVPVTVLPPGYLANKPTLKVVRTASAPANLPVKVEVVTDAGGGGKLSFGYDSRASTAPQSFTAAIDLTDRDLQPDTSQALVNMSITPGNSTAVGLVTETFDAGTGLAESLRTNRSVTAITYEKVAALGTQVPTSATVDFTSATGMQHVILTRAQPTTTEVLLDSPNHDPTLKGRIDKLPANVELTIVTEDNDSDGNSDQLSVDYSGSDLVHDAQLSYESLTKDITNGDHRPTLAFDVHDLPKVMHLDYDIVDKALTFDTPTRTTRIDVTGDDTVAFFERAKHFALTLEDVPLALDASFGNGQVKLDGYTASDRHSHDALAALGFVGQEIATPTIAVPACATPPCGDGYDSIRDPSLNGAVHEDIEERYLLTARLHKLKSANIVTTPSIDILIDTAPDLGPPGSACGEFPPPGCTDATESFRPFEALLKSIRVDEDPATAPDTTLHAKIQTLWPATHFTQGHHGGLTPNDTSDDVDYIGYENGGTLSDSTDITVDADNLAGPKGTGGVEADLLHVQLDGVPNNLQFSYGAGGFPMKVRTPDASAGIRNTDVRLTSRPVIAADLLPNDEIVTYFHPGGNDTETRNLDGVQIRDFADRYTINARIAWLRTLTVDKDSIGGADTPCVNKDKICVQASVTSSGNNPRLRFDSESATSFNFGDGTSLPGVARILATLDRIPSTLMLRQFEGANKETRLSYQGSAVEGVLGDPEEKGLKIAQTTTYTNPIPDGIRPDSDTEFSLVPMPLSFELCRSSDGPVCSGGIFNRDDADGGSLQVTASPRTRMHYQDQPNLQAQVFTVADITADVFRFQADATDAGYLAFDTGWDSSSSSQPPPSSMIGQSVIREVNGTRDITLFQFHDGFAASHRMIKWSSSTILFLADHTDISDLLDYEGRPACTYSSDSNLTTDLDFKRVEPNTGLDLDINLTGEFCGFPFPPH